MARKKTSKQSSETKPENKDNIYVVERGDTPAKIARKLSLESETWLRNKNKLSPTDRLEIGQELIVKD